MERLSISLPSNRKKLLAFLYATFSILEEREDLQIARIIEKSLEISVNHLLKMYKDYFENNKEKIAEIMKKKFKIENAEEVVQKILNGTFLNSSL